MEKKNTKKTKNLENAGMALCQDYITQLSRTSTSDQWKRIHAIHLYSSMN